MSRFDVLSKEFAGWHEDAWTVQVAWRRLPYMIANAVRDYLGAPETFKDVSISESPKKHSYVTPADATWNENTASFDLKISERGAMMRSFDLNQSDGRYYFGMVVYLESGPNTFPKHPFWFLLSVGWVNQQLSQVRIQRVQRDYLITTNSYVLKDLEPICSTIEQLLLADLSLSPFERRDKLKISLTDGTASEV